MRLYNLLRFSRWRSIQMLTSVCREGNTLYYMVVGITVAKVEL